MRLFEGYLPEGTVLSVEVYDNKYFPYLFRLVYTSKNSGKKICMVAKGETLPTQHDYVFRYYLKQLVLEPREISREFSRRYFLSRRAKQDEFLFGSKNIRVSGKTNRQGEDDGAAIEEKIDYKEYA